LFFSFLIFFNDTQRYFVWLVACLSNQFIKQILAKAIKYRRCCN
jgi:hypothetical protein